MKGARRLFFALWPDAAGRQALLTATAAAVAASAGRPVPEQSLHLTLLFLGSVAPERAAHLPGAARQASARVPQAQRRLEVELVRLAHWREAAVLAALGSASAGVEHLAAGLRAAVGPDFRLDVRPFRAHVTVARQVQRAGPLGAIAPVRWDFDAFALIESRSARGGPLYSVVESYPLVGA
ncbi:MAG: RNA 2',3'-cyclic phosphodiesterase [Gammaproteobacteria bacterium]|nr:RNA 2',3'-cyclic phosphodiesterase [Gammaproteobacteria bacterium]